VGCSYETRPQAKANYEKWVVVVGCALRGGGGVLEDSAILCRISLSIENFASMRIVFAFLFGELSVFKRIHFLSYDKAEKIKGQVSIKLKHEQ